MAAHFPQGISNTTSALSSSPPPNHSRRASGLAFLNKGRTHTHLPRGLEVIIQAGTHYHNLLQGHSKGEKVFTLIEKETFLSSPSSWHWKLWMQSFFLAQKSFIWRSAETTADLKHFISSSETLSLFIFPSRSVWLLCHMTAECGDRRRGRILGCLALPAASPGPKGITRPSSICLHIPQ